MLSLNLLDLLFQAKIGNTEAQYNLGVCYYNGRGVTQDYKQAVYWLTKAAEQGIAEAQYNLGVCYYNGRGVTQDYKQAVYWFIKAAEQGFANAQNNLGTCYEEGIGVNKDYGKAKYMYEQSAKQGLEFAKSNLSRIINEKINYWEQYKQDNIEKAITIEEITGENFDLLSDEDAVEKIHSIERLCKQNDTNLEEIKSCIISMTAFTMRISGLTIEEVEKKLYSDHDSGIDLECKTYNIKPYNSARYYALKWIKEWIKKEKQKQRLQKIKEIISELNLDWDEIEKNQNKLNLAPDLSNDNNRENKLFKLAKNAVNYINNNFKKLSSQGEKEALIFCSHLIIDLGTNHQNQIDLEKLEDRYFLLLYDEIMLGFDIEDHIEFINNRIKLYKNNGKGILYKYLYELFYINPCLENISQSDVYINNEKFLKFSNTLNSLEEKLNKSLLSI